MGWFPVILGIIQTMPIGYIYTAGSGYSNYFHVDLTGHRFLGGKSGYYRQGSSTKNDNAVIYPDEAFIIAKRKVER